MIIDYRKSIYLICCLVVLVNSCIVLNALFFDALPKVINTIFFYFVLPIGLAAVLRKTISSKKESITFLLIIPSLFLWLAMMIDGSYIELKNWLNPPILLKVNTPNDALKMDDKERYFLEVKPGLNAESEVREYQYTSSKKGTEEVVTIYHYLQGIRITNDGVWVAQSKSNLRTDQKPAFELKEKGTLFGLQLKDPYDLNNFEPICGKKTKALFELVSSDYATYISQNKNRSLIFLVFVNCSLVLLPLVLFWGSHKKRE